MPRAVGLPHASVCAPVRLALAGPNRRGHVLEHSGVGDQRFCRWWVSFREMSWWLWWVLLRWRVVMLPGVRGKKARSVEGMGMPSQAAIR